MDEGRALVIDKRAMAQTRRHGWCFSTSSLIFPGFWEKEANAERSLREGCLDLLNLYLSTASRADSTVTIARAKVSRDSRGWARVSCLNILTDRDLNAPIHSSRADVDVKRTCVSYDTPIARSTRTDTPPHTRVNMQARCWRTSIKKMDILTTLIKVLTYGKLRTKCSLPDQKVVWKIPH